MYDFANPADSQEVRALFANLDWSLTRRAVRVEDRRLMNDTQRWARTIPAQYRPVLLLAQFPRIANRFAQMWGEVDQVDEYLDDLLVDKRGGRQGFPTAVRAEIELLQQYRWACAQDQLLDCVEAV